MPAQQFKLDTDAEKKSFAEKLTRDLNKENPPVQTSGSKRGQPHNDGYLMFQWEVKRILSKQQYSQDLMRNCWNELGATEQKIWKDVQKKSVDVFTGEIDKTAKIKRVKAMRRKIKCLYCMLTGWIDYLPKNHIIRIHFPHRSPELDAQLISDLKAMKKNEDYTNAFHSEVIKFYKSLFAEKNSLNSDQRQLIQKYKKLFDESLKSDDQTGTLYFGVQFENNEWQSVQGKDLAAELFQYVGKCARDIRHFELVHSSGKIKTKLGGLVRSRKVLAQDAKIPQSMRFYFWKCLQIPVKSLAAFEQATIMALFHLSGRDSKFLNQNVPSIPVDNNFHDAFSKELVFLGIYIAFKLVTKLQADLQSNAFESSSVELIAKYDSFGPEEQAKFDQLYSVNKDNRTSTSDDKRDDLLKALYDLAKQDGDEKYLQLFEQYGINGHTESVEKDEIEDESIEE